MLFFFPQNFIFCFLPTENQRFFFSHSLRAKIFFFSGQSKNKVFIFPKQHICIILDLYVRVFLEPNIHGYIVYMFGGYTCILNIWVRVYMYILKLVSISTI